MANNGYLDDVDIKKVKVIEQDLFALLDSKYTDFCKELIKDKITDDMKKKMHEICAEAVARHK